MNYTQNEKIMSITENTLIIGIDIAKEVNYARAFDYRGIELGKVKAFQNSFEGLNNFREWAQSLACENQKNNVVVGLEPTGHYWFNLGHYLKCTNMRLVLVNPYHVKRIKELDDNSQTKNDLKDPKTIAKLVIEGRYLEPYIPEGIYSNIRIAIDMRENLINNVVRVKNKITQWIDKYFPEFNDVFSDWEGLAALICLKQFPTPEKVLSMNVNQIVALWRKEIKTAVGAKRAAKLMDAAKSTIGIKEGIVMAERELSVNLEQYILYKKQQEQLEKEIEELVLQVPGVKEMLTIKSVGILTAAGFIAEVGDITRFKDPRQIQKLAGFNLIESSSGKHKGKTSISKRGRSRLRALLFRAIMPIVCNNAEFKTLHEYYTKRKENPLKKKQSLIVLCCKLIRIVYTILTKKVKYNPEKLLKDINRNNLKEVA